ncbi:hypothetical protein ACOSP7_013054 [Xanthoceras sorbifolium]
MLVQDRTVSNSPKSQIRQQLHTINHHRFSESKSLDFSTWVSENLYKIIVVLLLVTTIAALFVLRSSSDAASLLQSQSQQHSPSSISLTVIKWNSITPITDRSSVYSMFRSEKWIVFLWRNTRLILEKFGQDQGMANTYLMLRNTHLIL